MHFNLGLALAARRIQEAHITLQNRNSPVNPAFLAAFRTCPVDDDFRV